MSGLEYLKFMESNYSPQLILSSNTGIPRADSDSSMDSCFSGTLKEGDSLLSCSESEFSIRTGSVAYQPLPPRPAPPPPPPSQRQPSRRTKGNNTSTSSSTETTRSDTTVVPNKCKLPARSKSSAGKTRSFRRPRLNRALSSDAFTKPKLMSLPVENGQISRTFSSEGLQGILFSLPPAYPPPLPPDSPPQQPTPPLQRYKQPSPFAPLVPPKPQLSATPPIPPKPKLSASPPIPPKPQLSATPSISPNLQLVSPPLLPLPSRAERRRVPNEADCNISKSSVVCCPANRGSCFLRKRTLIFLTIFSFILSIVCCCFSVFSFLYFMYQQKLLQICVPLGNNESDVRTATFRRLLPNNETNMFCAKTGDEISQLMHAMLDISRNVSVPSPAWTPQSNHASAHAFFSKTGATSCGLHRLQLKKLQTGKFNEHLSNVDIKEGGFSISLAGLYYVYSSVLFNSYSGTKCTNIEKEWRHSIIRESQGSPHILTQSSHNCNGLCVNDRHSSYTGGVFHLQKNDVIFVNVTNQDFIDTDEYSSYIGIFMVNSTELCQNKPNGTTCSEIKYG